MPGAYAHITLVNVLREPARLQAIGFSNQASAAVLDYLRFVELGAVSPDYPYLSILEGNSAQWADLMHYERTGEMVKAGIEGVNALEGEPKRRAFSWLLGYAAHVATDVTIHPVVELKVGPYAENKKEHRICEMHQDAYIFSSRMNLGEIGLSEHLSSGIGRCTERGTPGVVDVAVKKLWRGMLTRVHPQHAADNPPDIDQWHRGFDRMVNKIGEEGNRLMPIARHIAVNCGLTYPAVEDIDHAEYVTALEVPTGKKAHYNQIFDRAIESVGKAWRAIERAVYQDDHQSPGFFGNWNLDTGRDETGRLVFWS